MTFHLSLVLNSPIPWTLPRHLLCLLCHTSQVRRGRKSDEPSRNNTLTRAHTSAQGKHPEIKRQVVDLTGQDASGHGRLEGYQRVAQTSKTLWKADFYSTTLTANSVLSARQTHFEISQNVPVSFLQSPFQPSPQPNVRMAKLSIGKKPKSDEYCIVLYYIENYLYNN